LSRIVLNARSTSDGDSAVIGAGVASLGRSDIMRSRSAASRVAPRQRFASTRRATPRSHGRILRHIAQSAPGGHEHVGDDIIGVLGIDAPPDVRPNRRIVRRIHGFKSGPRIHYPDKCPAMLERDRSASTKSNRQIRLNHEVPELAAPAPLTLALAGMASFGGSATYTH
jgi:hypothetical protein